MSATSTAGVQEAARSKTEGKGNIMSTKFISYAYSLSSNAVNSSLRPISEKSKLFSLLNQTIGRLIKEVQQTLFRRKTRYNPITFTTNNTI